MLDIGKMIRGEPKECALNLVEYCLAKIARGLAPGSHPTILAVHLQCSKNRWNAQFNRRYSGYLTLQTSKVLVLASRVTLSGNLGIHDMKFPSAKETIHKPLSNCKRPKGISCRLLLDNRLEKHKTGFISVCSVSSGRMLPPCWDQ